MRSFQADAYGCPSVDQLANEKIEICGGVLNTLIESIGCSSLEKLTVICRFGKSFEVALVNKQLEDLFLLEFGFSL